MSDNSVKLNPEFRWETLGDDVVALDRDSGCVYRLSGASAAVTRYLLNGSDHQLIAEEYDAVLRCLVDEGILRSGGGGVSRRTLVRTGTAVALGITVLVLPAAQAAASTGGASQYSPPLGTTTTPASSSTTAPTTTTTTTVPATTTSTTTSTTTTTTIVDNLPATSVTSVSTTSVSWTQQNV